MVNAVTNNNNNSFDFQGTVKQIVSAHTVFDVYASYDSVQCSRMLDALLCIVLSPGLGAAAHGKLRNSMNTVWFCSHTPTLRDSSDGADYRWSVFAVKG